MDMTLVVRCGSDPKVFDCISSVDEDVEILVSSIPDPDFEDRLRESGVNVCTSPSGNLSVASNTGIMSASFDKVFLTDSDTILAKGCLSTVYELLDEYPVVCARIVFEDDGTRLSRRVADARSFVNSKKLAFTPGLGFDRRVAGSIGGYMFDDDVPFAVDANLDFRLKHNGSPVSYGSTATIQHSMESVRHDMVAARRIGAGVQKGAERLEIMYPDVPFKEIRRSLKAVHWNDYPTIISQYGLGTALYQAVWDLNFYIGRAGL